MPSGITTDLDGVPRFVDDPLTADTGSGAPPLVDMGAYERDDNLLLSPVYRFWSPIHSRHFYTISVAERDHVINTWPDVWTYEGIAYYAFAGDSEPDVAPVYRFWSGTLNAHFYTSSEAEKAMLIDEYAHVWTFEGVAFYAYAEGFQPPGTGMVHRFWSPRLSCHFYTISQAERDMVVDLYPSIWTYEGLVWYAYAP